MNFDNFDKDFDKIIEDDEFIWRPNKNPKPKSKEGKVPCLRTNSFERNKSKIFIPGPIGLLPDVEPDFNDLSSEYIIKDYLSQNLKPKKGIEHNTFDDCFLPRKLSWTLMQKNILDGFSIIDISHILYKIKNKEIPGGKIEFLAGFYNNLLIDDYDSNIIELKDETGCIEVVVNCDALNHFHQFFVPGSSFLFKQVSIFSPYPTSSPLHKSYAIVTKHNVVAAVTESGKIWLSDTYDATSPPIDTLHQSTQNNDTRHKSVSSPALPNHNFDQSVNDGIQGEKLPPFTPKILNGLQLRCVDEPESPPLPVVRSFKRKIANNVSRFRFLSREYTPPIITNDDSVIESQASARDLPAEMGNGSLENIRDGRPNNGNFLQDSQVLSGLHESLVGKITGKSPLSADITNGVDFGGEIFGQFGEIDFDIGDMVKVPPFSSQRLTVSPPISCVDPALGNRDKILNEFADDDDEDGLDILMSSLPYK